MAEKPEKHDVVANGHAVEVKLKVRGAWTRAEIFDADEALAFAKDLLEAVNRINEEARQSVAALDVACAGCAAECTHAEG
ncbi:MAG TPA: hypothetical protein VEA38_25805 [Terriglobales bacterium]|nr:hypothetical protein [Terriglobales bacterium]